MPHMYVLTVNCPGLFHSLRYIQLALGYALVSIDVVAVRRARLILEWVIVCGRVNRLGM